MDTTYAPRRLTIALALSLFASTPLLAQSAAGTDAWPVDARTGMAPVGTVGVVDDVSALAPGEYTWNPERTGAGQVLVVVSLPAQRAHVYRNGVRIGVTTVSTGTASHPTPTGVFEILQKKEMHRSNLYNDAPMPYMQRLTWDGIALHAGRIPGYPASHGCVRLPKEFARLLYQETSKGMLVVIADEGSHSYDVLYPGSRAPLDTYSGLPLGDTSRIAAAPAREATPSAPKQQAMQGATQVAALPD